MSVDRTLHIKSGSARKRSVLKRPERIAIMAENALFVDETNSPLGLPKTRVRHSRAGAKAKKEEAPAAVAGAEGAAAPAAAPAAPPAGKQAGKPAGKKGK